MSRYRRNTRNNRFKRRKKRVVLSHGEEAIAAWLNDYAIPYERQMQFANCRSQRALRFDFYLPDEGALIEYDGKHHFESVAKWGGKRNLQSIQMRDEIKNRFAEQNGYRLIRIPYWQKESIAILLEELIL